MTLTKLTELEPDYVEELDIPVKIDNSEKHRPIFEYGQDYTIILRERFSELMPCEACNYPKKTFVRVVVRNEATGQEFRIGIYCLVENFDITEAELDSSITPVTLLIENWHRYIIKLRPDLNRLDSRDAELNAMLELLPDNLGFSSAVTKNALALIGRLVKYKAYISDYKSDIEVLQSFIGLQHDYRFAQTLFMDRGFNLAHHPKLSKIEQAQAKDFFADPESTTWQNFRELHEIFGKARRAQLPTYRITDVLPYLYNSSDTYFRDLQNHMMGLSNRDARAYELHNYARRVEQVIEADLSNPNSGLSRDRYASYSLAFDTDAVSSTYKLKPFLVRQIEQKKYLYFLSSKSRPFKQQIERTDNRSLRAIQRESQREEESDRKSDLLEQGYFRQLVIWKPERWYKSYAVWQKYGNVVETRRILETPTSQL